MAAAGWQQSSRTVHATATPPADLADGARVKPVQAADGKAKGGHDATREKTASR